MGFEMDKISVIVPVYNIEKYLRRCIDSIISQSYKNLQIILVDDGSTDNSGRICDDYATRDSRIVVIHKENGGLGFARNSGLDVATGKYVTFIDGDDYIGLSRIEKMYIEITRTGADTCLSGHTRQAGSHFYARNNVCSGKIFSNNIKQEILPRMCGTDTAGNDYIEMSVCMALFSNEIINDNQLRFVSERDYISEDLVFDFSYYPLSNRVCVSDTVDYYYCDNEGSLTTKYRKDRFESQIKLYNLLVRESKELGIEKICKPRLQNTAIAIARYSIKLAYKYIKTNGREATYLQVHEICSNESLKEIFSEYDDKKIKFSSRFVNYLIKNKCYYLLKIVMTIKNTFNI